MSLNEWWPFNLQLYYWERERIMMQPEICTVVWSWKKVLEKLIMHVNPSLFQFEPFFPFCSTHCHFVPFCAILYQFVPICARLCHFSPVSKSKQSFHFDQCGQIVMFTQQSIEYGWVFFVKVFQKCWFIHFHKYWVFFRMPVHSGDDIHCAIILCNWRKILS